MNDLSVYFRPVSHNGYPEKVGYNDPQLGSLVRVFASEKKFPELDGIEIVFLGVEEDRRAVGNTGCGNAASAVREYLYRLYPGNYTVRMADLGNIKKGHTVEDTYFALTSVCHELIKNSILPVVIGGGQDLTYAMYKSYQNIESTISITGIDSRLDLGEPDDEFSSRTYLGKIILDQPNMLFNFCNIGYQTYFAEPRSITLFSKLFFECTRLGEARANLEEMEPGIRGADMLTVDISSVRSSDAPANANSSPNGFYGEEICQLMRYAGMNDKLSSLGIFEVNPGLEQKGQTAHLVAQMVWCFIDGYYNRKKDFPFTNATDYITYRVSIKEHKEEMVFYKSNKSDRWWMNVPYPIEKKLKYERHHLVPCSYSDYKTACREEVPDRWWQTYQKLS